MIILIAESKTMVEREEPVATGVYEAHRPVGEKIADEIMARVSGIDAAEIAAAMKVSAGMAAKALRMAYEFPNKQTGLRAIESFTGVVFKNFDYKSLSDTARLRTYSNVRIISSLYGWLRPDDIIKPYRFDYTTPLAPDDRALCSYWKNDVTEMLIKEVQATGCTEILDLLPADAGKCIDWRQVQAFANVWKVDFKEQNGTAVKTPHAGKLKAMRGTLLRCIIENDINGTDRLKRLETDIFMPLGTPDRSDRIAFCV